ncbi:hypothetical protein OIO90_005260 [Microbotryomycetes sp. JL221]|nr:hypothetical protein OIO90_005260 [Microbotryomycetes sp. JL221]
MTESALPHSKALLSYLISTYSKDKHAQASSPPTATHDTQQLDVKLRKLALAQSQSRAKQSNPSTASETSSTDTEDEDAATASSTDGHDELSEKEKISRVIEMLEDDSIEEDDKPDNLKSLLTSILVLPNFPPVDLDPIILSLLHRYREDVNPSGNPVPPLPNHGSTTPGSRPSVSRSSSFRRLGGASTPRLAPGSASNAFSSGVSNASSAPTSPAHSPWQSPRPTNLTLALSASASEFRPGGSHSSRPGTPFRSHSPNPMAAAQQAQAQWAATSSPLGTPKLNSNTSGAATASNASSPGYFGRVVEPTTRQKTSRLPWADSSAEDGDSDEHDDDEPDIDSSTDGLERDGEQFIDTAPEDGPPVAWGEMPSQAVEAHMMVPQYAYYPPPEGTPEWAAMQSMYAGYAGGPMWQQGAVGAFEGHFMPAHSRSHTPTTYEAPPMVLPGPAPGEVASIDFANELTGPSGLGLAGAYIMSPFDHLLSIFAPSGISPEVLEEALEVSGFDVDKAIEHVINTQDAPELPPEELEQPQRQALPGSGARPLVVSQDSFNGFNDRARWGAAPGRSQTPDNGRGVGGRVCRYYMAGNCLRSDCKFSHDVSRAVCKFWLRGHCLKGEGRCDFMHSIPPIMQADFEQRAHQRHAGPTDPRSINGEDQTNEGPDLDFPTLGQDNRSRHQGVRNAQLDPTRTRFSGAVKFGSKVPATPASSAAIAASRMPPPAAPPSRDAMPKPKRSVRITLRPPMLLPTLPTGSALAALYVKYRSSFLELGANRNKCLARAAECWKRGDGAGARKFSREAQDWSRQVAIEGRDSAAKIVEERKRVLREAVKDNEGRGGTTDDAPDRKMRGQERGGGIVLGVVAQSALPSNERALTVDERTEVALDLHALHTDEAISFMGDYLLALEKDNFAGIAYIVIGQSKHSGSSATDQKEAAGRLRLEQACTEFVRDQGWAWNMFGGIMAIDVQR